jgi:hypothetical protein
MERRETPFIVPIFILNRAVATNVFSAINPLLPAGLQSGLHLKNFGMAKKYLGYNKHHKPS